MVNVPVRGPTAAGVNVTEMTQFPPTAIVEGEVGQLLVWRKSAPFVPPTTNPVIASEALPVLVRVIF